VPTDVTLLLSIAEIWQPVRSRGAVVYLIPLAGEVAERLKAAVC
jgi:hypothetical protein